MRPIATKDRIPTTTKNHISSVGRLGNGRRSLLTSLQRAATTGKCSGSVARAIERWSRIWSLPNLPGSISVRINKRLRTSVARWVVDSGRLELSVDFFEPNLDHEAILCHEIAHAAAIAKYGRQIRSHGTEWRSLLQAAGFDPYLRRSVRQPNRKVSAPRLASLYLYRCPVCHAVRIARRRMRTWRCSECVQLGLEGALDITVIRSRGASR